MSNQTDSVFSNEKSKQTSDKPRFKSEYLAQMFFLYFFIFDFVQKEKKILIIKNGLYFILLNINVNCWFL